MNRGLCMAIVAGVVALPLHAQTPSSDARRPAFTTASIVPSAPGAAAKGGIRIQPGGRLSGTGVTLRQLVAYAWSRHAFDRPEITGGPPWVDAERFDVNAEAGSEHVFDADGAPRRTWAMLRALLADRFGLAVRHDAQRRPVYTLAFARDDKAPGPRLQRSAVDCGAVMDAMLTGRWPMDKGPQCASTTYPGRLVASAVPMAVLASLLSAIVDRPVVDRTGLTGNFDVEVEAVEIRSGDKPHGPSYRPSDAKQSIFDTLPEQLGLALKPSLEDVDVLVISGVERLR